MLNAGRDTVDPTDTGHRDRAIQQRSVDPGDDDLELGRDGFGEAGVVVGEKLGAVESRGLELRAMAIEEETGHEDRCDAASGHGVSHG